MKRPLTKQRIEILKQMVTLIEAEIESDTVDVVTLVESCYTAQAKLSEVMFEIAGEAMLRLQVLNQPPPIL